MRKLKLFMAALALTGWGNFVLAQTDVTSTYLTNADFSSKEGWTQVHSSQYWELGNGLIGTYAVANDKKSTTDATHLATEYCFGIQCRWETNYAAFTQKTAELQVGVYTLTYDVQNTNACTSATYENRFTVVAGGSTYTDSKTEWMKGSSGWTTHTINFTVNEATTATISLGYGIGSNHLGSGSTPHLYVSHLKLTWTDILQGAKDALQAEIDKAKLCDAKEGLADAIAAAESTLTNATTVAELETALATLQTADKDAVLRYENGLADATYAAPITTSFVVNGTFTDNVNGWTCTGGFQNKNRASNQSGAFTVPFFENWNGDPKANKMYQTISNIPNGTYRLDIAAFVNTLADPNESQFVFANSDKTYLTTGAPTAYEVYTVVTNNQIEIGLEQTTATANWMGIDNVSLRYYGAGDVINDAKNASHKLAWEEAKTAAEAAIANTDYANVTGSEKTALQAEIDKAEPTTAEGYDEAAAALNAATATFTAAKPNYDIFATYNTELQYADASKKPAITNESTAASITTALRAYYESHALAEGVSNALNMTDRINNAADPTNNDGWTWDGSKNNPASNEPWTDADGTNTHSYFDGGDWNGSNWTTTMKQTISIPAGKYLLTAKGRAATNTTLTMAVGEKSVNLPNIGNAGNVFDRGWGDGSVEFETDGSDVEIVVTATASPTHEWFSVCDFRLVQLEFYSDAYASTTDDYADLNTAIANAEAMTLGFEVGEYAPYVNANALKALAEAKAMDQTAVNTNLKTTIASLVAAMNNWTANTDEVNAVNTALFTSGDVTGTGWTQTQSWGQFKEDVYSTSNGTFTYGEVAGFEMPLKANTVYKLTFNHRAWDGSNAENGGTVSVLYGEDGLAATSFTGQGTNTTPKTETFYFKTGAAGNYVFTLNAPSGRPTFGGVTILKAVAENITISEDATAAPAENYANVKLTRTLKADIWNTFSVPFDAAKPEGWTVKEFESADGNTLNFKDATEIKAGVPYLVKTTADVAAPTFNGVIVKATEGETKGEGDYKFAAQIYNKPFESYGTVAYLATDGTIKKLTSGGIKGLRAYFIVPAKAATARIAFIDGGSTTGIESVASESQKAENGVYDLQGRSVKAMKKGLYIVNGKKVVK